MPIQHSPPARQTRSHARAQARTHFGRRSTIQEGRKRAKKINSFSGVVGRFPATSRTIFRGHGEDGEEEESDGTVGVPALVGASQGTGGPTLAQYNQSEQSLLAIMQQMTQIMANLQAAPSPDSSTPPAIKEPECFDGTQPFKVRSFIQS
ncbi:hypothetical protein O181_034744 [Austropuccinia psidii MF-1]|uniref:Uncharacterized protein n=1 Tax=Austropuccinia psidii MF-1 TaxID=1389203 RepID=A0A9Q3D1D6_9BASI|nr:hypothetical protein [Austropuccinia psidii MF-1]